MFLSLRIKILGLLMLLVAGLAIVFTESGTRLIQEKMDELFQSRLLGASEGVAGFWEREKSQILRTATLFSESEKILSFSLYGLHNLLQKEVRRLLAGTPYSELQIHLKSGMILNSGWSAPGIGSKLNAQDAHLNLSRVNADSREHSLELEAIVPIQKLGEFFGLLTLRRRVNDEALRDAARFLQIDLAVGVKGEMLASSLVGDARRDFLQQLYNFPGRNPRFFRVTILGIRHSVTTIDIAETPGRETISIYAILSEGKIISMIEQARTRTITITVLALTVALILSLVFAEVVLTSRIRLVRDSSRLVAQGDLSVQVPAAGADELGDLARSFNDMTGRLRENRDRLMHQNLELQHYIDSLESLKSYIQNILSSLSTCVITWNRQGKIDSVNLAAERQLGEFFGKLSGISFRYFTRPLDPDSRKRFWKMLRLFVQEGHPITPFDLEFDLGPGHGFKVMQGNFAYVRDPGGQPYGLVFTLEDITQRKIIEQQLYHADKLSSIGQLAASVAH